MIRAREQRQVVVLYVLTDLLIYWVSLTAASWARVVPLSLDDLLPLQRDRALCVALFAVAALATGCYQSSRIVDRFDSVYYILGALMIALVAEFVLATVFLSPLRVISRRELLIGFGIASALLTLWHGLAVNFIVRFGSLHRLFYILGEGEQSNHILEALTQDRSVEVESGTLDELGEKIERLNSGEEGNSKVLIDVIITEEERGRDEKALYEVLAYCEEHCRRTFMYPSLDDILLFQHTGLLAIAGIPLVEIIGQNRKSGYAYLKRAIDIAASAIGLLLSLPICAATAILIKATSPGPVFYTQERLTLGGRPFKIYKFRSMRSDIEVKDKNGHLLAQENDARVTAVGRFVRKHRIDEIPQFFNVLKGDMSLIGPRPVWKEFYEDRREALPLFERRLSVRPGLASLSHVLGSYSSKMEDRLRYDLVYISTCSFLVDLKIMLATVRIVLSGRGAM